MFSTHTRVRGRRLAPAIRPSDLIEALEQRTLLSAPLPQLADLQDPLDPVVRLTTRYGEIDIELLATQRPAIVSAFLNGIESRGLSPDQTFFHRLIPGIALQGGLYGFVDTTSGPGSAIPVNEPVETPFDGGLANTQRTIAMGRLVDSGSLGTSTFIFNLTDNSSRYDPAQMVVFARVVDNRSWNVVQTIASLPTADLADDTSFAGFFAGSFHQVPVTRIHIPGDTVTPDLLVQTYDLSIIRDPSTPDFYRFTTHESEGYLNSNIHEFVPMENPTDDPIYYRVTARYEQFGRGPWIRDDTIAVGVIAPHSRGGITLARQLTGEVTGLRYTDQPFAIEIQSTAPLAASLSHYDFGSTIAHPFTENTSTSWFFPQVSKETNNHDFFVWYNPTDEVGDVTVTLSAQDGTVVSTLHVTTDRFRRGGVNLLTNGAIPDGVYAARITSTAAIVVSRSHYVSEVAPSTRVEGYAEAGATGAPSIYGVIPIAADPGASPSPDGPNISITVFNTGSIYSVVSFAVYAPGSTTPIAVFPNAIRVEPGETQTFSQRLSITSGQYASVTYTATEPVYASYSMRRAEGTYGGAVLSSAATSAHFADGFTDASRAAPNTLEESLNIFNPYGAVTGSTARDASVSLIFRYTDGTSFTINQIVEAGTMLHVPVSRLQQIQAQSAVGRYFYSIEVSSDIAVVTQMMHVDVSLGTGSNAGGGFIVGGSLLSGLVRLDGLM